MLSGELNTRFVDVDTGRCTCRQNPNDFRIMWLLARDEGDIAEFAGSGNVDALTGAKRTDILMAHG